MQSIVPYLAYDDVSGARDFLVAAFGFGERRTQGAAHGKAGHTNHTHVELEFDDGSWIKLGPVFAADTASDARSRVTIQVWVKDIDTHFARAKAAGATIVMDLQENEHGDRVYRATDPEGLLWQFVRDVSD